MPLLHATTTAGLPGLFGPQLSCNFRATCVSPRRVQSAGSSSPCVVRCRGDIRKAVVLPARNWEFSGSATQPVSRASSRRFNRFASLRVLRFDARLSVLNALVFVCFRPVSLSQERKPRFDARLFLVYYKYKEVCFL